MGKMNYVAASAVAMGALLFTGCGEAENGEAENGEFPSQDLTLLIPYAAGGGTDSIARAIAPHLEEELGQTVLVVNRPGGSGAVATTEITNTQPDGHTMIMAAASPTIAGSLLGDVGYEPSDITPIGRAVAAPNVLVVTDDSPYQSADELFEAAQAGEEVRIGTVGTTGMTNLAIDLMNEELDTEIIDVPLDGGAGATAGLLSGDVDTIFATTVDVASLINSGDANIIAATESETVPDELAQNVPSLEEQGVHPPAGSDWYGVAGPPEMPEDVTATWAEAVEVAMQQDEVVSSLEEIGAEPGYLGPEEFEQSITGAWDIHAELAE